MIIETKRNINDMVWKVEREVDRFFVDCFVIGGITVGIEVEDFKIRQRVYYTRKDDCHLVPEENCFMTREEAQMECDHRNLQIEERNENRN